mmetsp:Transcript_29836/g.96267  ORF Transcript_29836/g.96267 Transcript_29836/m.96267 type:complete len:419 (-) Transcript_29836:209-1465(-)
MRVSRSFAEVDPTLEGPLVSPPTFVRNELYERRWSVSDWVANLVNFPQSLVLSRISSHLAFNVVWAVAVVALFASYPEVRDRARDADVFLPFQLAGGIIGIGLAFRTSQSYDRFWRGRELWAVVMNKTRALARLSAAYAGVLADDGRHLAAKMRRPENDRLFRQDEAPDAPDDPFAATRREEVHEEIVRWLVAFAVALKQHLRCERDLGEFECLNDVERSRLATATHAPLACCYALSTAIDPFRRAADDDDSDDGGGRGNHGGVKVVVARGGGKRVVAAKRGGQGEGASLLWWQMEALVTDLQDTIGETEAIAGTPMPTVYTRHTSRLLSVWTLSTPVVLGAAHFPLTLVPLATVVVSWMLLATEEIGHLIEEPFGIGHPERPQLLPLDRYCAVIKKDLYEMNALRRRAFDRRTRDDL